MTSFIIPNSLTSIGDYTFAYSTSLTSIIIPESVTSIGQWSFLGCSGLTNVYCYAKNVPKTDTPFDVSLIASATLHVPKASLKTYQKTSPWSKFGTIVAITQDDVDGIGNAQCSMLNVQSVYDLNGRRVTNPGKGLYIKNGKKVLTR
jgi:hypothetical protein